MIRYALLLAFSGVTAQAGTFTPPEGCTAHLTVQQRSCIVSHYWTCTGNAPGERWNAEFGQDGMIYLGKIDNEAQWLLTYYPLPVEEERLVQPAADPASLTALLATGIDTYDFTLDTTNGLNRVVGFDRITQRDVEIDGQTLHRTEYNIRTTNVDGDVIFAAEGIEYVSEKYRQFFSGFGTITEPDGPEKYDDTPVDFIHRGQPGFLSDEPQYDCAAITARHVIK